MVFLTENCDQKQIGHKFWLTFWPGFENFDRIFVAADIKFFDRKQDFLTENPSKKFNCQWLWPIGHNRPQTRAVLWSIVTNRSQSMAEKFCPFHLSEIPRTVSLFPSHFSTPSQAPFECLPADSLNPHQPTLSHLAPPLIFVKSSPILPRRCSLWWVHCNFCGKLVLPATLSINCSKISTRWFWRPCWGGQCRAWVWWVWWCRNSSNRACWCIVASWRTYATVDRWVLALDVLGWVH